MPEIRIVNWEKFQHYKDRNPPWIKLHRSLLDKREWHALSDSARALLVECWLVASESEDGVIRLTAADLAWRLRRPDIGRQLQELSAGGFVELFDQPASAVLAAC